MQRMHFFDRLFPTRSRPRVLDAFYLPHPWGRTSSIRGLVGRVFPPRSRPMRWSMHAVVILISAIGLVIASAAFAASWETTAVRTAGGGLIRIGMTRQEVLTELGQSERPRRNTAAGGKSARKGGSVTYRGDDGAYTMTFSGERVARIVVTPRRD